MEGLEPAHAQPGGEAPGPASSSTSLQALALAKGAAKPGHPSPSPWGFRLRSPDGPPGAKEPLLAPSGVGGGDSDGDEGGRDAEGEGLGGGPTLEELVAAAEDTADPAGALRRAQSYT